MRPSPLAVDAVLPHAAPAILLEHFWPPNGKTLEARVRLGRLQLVWAEAAGLPSAFAIEMLGQAAAIYLRCGEHGDALTGGRLALCEALELASTHLPLDQELGVQVTYQDGSSQGYHKFSGSVFEAAEAPEAQAVLARARFAVVALSAPVASQPAR